MKRGSGKHMLGLSLFPPSRQSNIFTSGEERFKYSLPRENKISQMPHPRANKDNQIPTPCPPRRLNIDRCIMSREELGGLLMYIFSQESRCRVTSDRKELIWKYIMYSGLRTLNIISFSLSYVYSETHNLQRVFLRIYDT